MSNAAKLKKQAAELELKKQFDKAIAVYVKLLDTFDEHAEELDVGLFNRVGDLMLRQGNVADAVDYYERAVDRYADTGFFNNAIALCNKILRHSPGRASVYYKLGKISAQKGFKNDAKVNFLEYADRMQKSGKMDEAFRALKEFADLCPDQDDIRLMLADQLTKIGRGGEAIEQLQTLYERYDAEGRATEAAATAERMRAIDPSVEPRSGGGRQAASSGDLIFLDLDAPVTASSSTPPTAAPRASMTAAPVTPAAPASHPAPAHPAPSHPTPARATPARATPAQVPVIERAASTELEIELTAASPDIADLPPLDTPLPGITRVDDGAPDAAKTPSESLLGLESTQLEDVAPPAAADGSLLDLEPTALFAEPLAPPSPSARPAPEEIAFTEMPAPMDAATTSSIYAADTLDDADNVDNVDDAGDDDSSGPELELIMPDEPPARSFHPTPRTTQSVLAGLPLMDDEPDAALDGRATPIEPPSESEGPPAGDDFAFGNALDLISEPEDGVPEPRAPEEIAAEPATRVAPETSAEPVADTDSFESLDTIELDDESFALPTPSMSRKSTMVAAQSVEILRASVEGEPENWGLRRELAEAMLDAGDRAGGMHELETAMAGAERTGDLDLASALAEEVARLEPDTVKHHQKRVEYAFRTNDRVRLVDAYLSLADALLRSDQADKARTVYQRVLELAPDEVRAAAALETIVVPEPPPPPPRASAPGRRSTIAMAPVPAPRAQEPSNDFVNLGDWLRDEEGPKDTRMVVAEQEPTGDEDADFADMLRKFKQGVAQNVDAEDYQSHYDLAIAYKEMGLIDEAIAEFQKALGSPRNRLPTYEALGQCFIEKGQFRLATSILSRALGEGAADDQLVGVLYLLGRAAEADGHHDQAVAYYQRVFVVDIQFRDVADRLNELERVAR